jgi:deoxyribodipyrimidine photolyase-related protein
MRKVAVIFPHQLFANHPVLSKVSDIVLVEDERFFGDFKFHKKKLVLHRASMRAYRKKLDQNGHKVHYISYERTSSRKNLKNLFQKLRAKEIYAVDTCDSVLNEKLQKLAKRLRLTLQVFGTPSFLSSEDWLREFFKDRRRFSMARFYTAQRKHLGVLVEDGKPIAGKWSFDAENRQRLPRNIEIPELPAAGANKFVREATEHVKKEFPDNPGSVGGFIYPVTHEGSHKWLRSFLSSRLEFFGPYEDAISKDQPFIFHSVMSPLLNIGLLEPAGVLQETLQWHRDHDVPLNSLEGFIRQIIGWREFIRAVYILRGDRQRTSNFWDCRNKIPRSFYDGTTGVEPVDAVIRRVLKYAYAHHIERLMVLGNFMLLCEIHPDEVYRWFMELFIDAYAWVMVPNVYGMSQYADGGLITTKPYISSSNYLRKTSDFPKGPWCEIWDSLFWRFISKHKSVFAKNPRMRVMALQLDRMDTTKLRSHKHSAECFLAELFS